MTGLKTLVFCCLALGLYSCAPHKKFDSSQQNKSMSYFNIHDIWALVQVEEKRIAPDDYGQIPNLEINLTENKILGNDGCNSYFGTIKKITKTEIQFSDFGRTEMYCDKMQATERFNRLLEKTTGYKRDGMKLYLSDKNGNRLLTFHKVD